MAIEIERKYLVVNDDYKKLAKEVINIKQGYLCRVPEHTVRVRIWNDKGYITVKGKNHGDVRTEFEYEIPFNDAIEMMQICEGKIIEKKRYIVDWEGKIWEVDEFYNDREGLVVAEIELKDKDAIPLLPSFVGEEVTGNPIYYNSNL